MILLMFILEVLLGLKSKQGDVTCAFLHADLAPDESVYVDMPLGFNTKSKNGKRQVLKIKQTGLTERVVEALGLDDGYAWRKHTPAETKPIIGW